jgi:transglutaminase-like putative cysteine protease
LEKIESIFYFVRDGIKFGFPPKFDEVKASQVIDYGLGYCNTKATLFLALS